jgi:hypothetical protein
VLAAWCGDDWWFAWPWPERISPVFPGPAHQEGAPQAVLGGALR